MEDHRRLMGMLKTYLERRGTRFVDLTQFVQKAVAKEPIGAKPLDYHLNTRGAELAAGKLFEELRRIEE